MTSLVETLIDALELLVPVEDIHADLAEGSAVMGEGTIAERGAGDGGEPAIEDGVFFRERSKDRQLFRREVVHDEPRVLNAALLVEVAFDEALHVWSSVRILAGGDSAEDLQVDRGKVVVGIGVELALVFGRGRDGYGDAGGIGIGFGAVKSVDGGVEALEAAKHVVEGAVLHHEHDDMLKLLKSWKLRVRHQF